MNYGAPQGSMPGPLPLFLDEDDDDRCINRINYPTISFYQGFFPAFLIKKIKLILILLILHFVKFKLK